MSLVPSLLQAVIGLDGEALVIHVGEKPYVVAPSGQVELATRALTFEAVTGILEQMLPVESRRVGDGSPCRAGRQGSVGRNRFARVDRNRPAARAARQARRVAETAEGHALPDRRADASAAPGAGVSEASRPGAVDGA